jgi:hypothetical protein
MIKTIFFSSLCVSLTDDQNQTLVTAKDTETVLAMRINYPPPWRDTRDASLGIVGSRPVREPWNTKCLRSISDLAFGLGNRSSSLIDVERCR